MFALRKCCLGILCILFCCFIFSVHPVEAGETVEISGYHWACPVEVNVPENPIPFRAEGEYHLVYEILLTNMASNSLVLEKIYVTDGGKVLVIYQDEDLESVLQSFSLPKNENIFEIPPGGRTVVFLWVSIAEEKNIPDYLSHRLSYRSPGNNEVMLLDAPLVAVHRKGPVHIASPVIGDNWLAAEGATNVQGFSHHRFGVIAMEGKTRVPQRYAIDWVRLGPDGKLFDGDPLVNENWYGYGEPIHSVADGVVINAVDGIPDNVPLSFPAEITLDNVAGNYVVVDIGEGAHALYAHLIPGSVLVEAGDQVSRGDVLGFLGNSGNSDGPHLHFQLNRATEIFPLAAEGLPFVHDSFTLTGKIPLTSPEVIQDLIDLSWGNEEDFATVELEYEMPLSYRIYTFTP